MKKARPLAYVAAGALLASALTHVTTFFGVNPARRFPPVLALHVLIGVVWVPMILMMHKMCKGSDRWRFWSIITRHAPLWMKALAIALVAYATFSFFFTNFVLTEGGTPAVRRGSKVLLRRGEVIRELTDQEYERHCAYAVRGYSGHWMVFYAVGMTVLYSLSKEDPTEPRNPPA